jgi:hypothetical protein
MALQKKIENCDHETLLIDQNQDLKKNIRAFIFRERPAVLLDKRC